jgi:hypothetical protein
MKTCIICQIELTKTQIKYCSNNCKQKAHYNKHVKSNTNTTYSQFKRADIRKKEFIQLKGGCCYNCGYNKNYSALHFHHIENKSFPLDSRNIGNRSLKSLKLELSKCVLLCANCHAEQHNPELIL